MARFKFPLVKGGGFYGSNAWVPLVHKNGVTTRDGGEEGGGGGSDASPIVGQGQVGYMVVGARGTSYTVGVSLTNPRYPEDFASCIIYGLNGTSYEDKGAQIGQIASPTGNTTVVVSSAGIVVEFTGQEGAPHIPVNACTITGDITMLPNYADYAMFTVSSDGSITIDGVNYDF